MSQSIDDISLNVSEGAIPEDKSDVDAARAGTQSRHPSLIKEDVEDRKADRALRDKYGDKAYKVARKSLYGWCWLLGIYACVKFRFDKELFSENVLIAITSAVTLNVFAAFLGVIRGLFPSNKPSKEKD
ncbi:hypothetical protein C1N58_12590 [Pantoea sp. SGAir0180]